MMRLQSLSVTGAAVVLWGVLPMQLVAQSTSAEPHAPSDGDNPARHQTQPVPRTEWGDPDLQGVWESNAQIPVERPAAFERRAVLTHDEVRQVRKRIEEVQARSDQALRTGDTGTYNSFWLIEPVVSSRTSQIIDPSNGRFPALTPWGEARLEARKAAARNLDPTDYGAVPQVGRGPADSWRDRTLLERCITMGLPLVTTGYNSIYHILQTPEYVVILTEMIHDARVIPLDGRPHMSSDIQQWHGDSRGWWDDNTLVVETTNFTGQINGNLLSSSPLNIGSAERLRIVERFTRIDTEMIDYVYTIHDPATYTRHWTGSLPWTRAGGQVYEYACHEGNYALPGILAGARKKERSSDQLVR